MGGKEKAWRGEKWNGEWIVRQLGRRYLNLNCLAFFGCSTAYVSENRALNQSLAWERGYTSTRSTLRVLVRRLLEVIARHVLH